MRDYVMTAPGDRFMDFWLSKYVIVTCLWGDYSFSSSFVGSPVRLQLTPRSDFCIKYAKNIVLDKKVPFGGPMTIFNIYSPKFPKHRHFGDRF